ncbi:MAG: glutamate-5-semialdehyde dehydrogenase [Spirochaetota bacterium]
MSLQHFLQELNSLWRKENARALEVSGALLCALAQELRKPMVQQKILLANQRDLAKLPSDDPMTDRLLLNEARLGDMATGLEQVAALPSPLGEELYRYRMPNGAQVRRLRVPVGLVLVIYESRPNVTVDLFSLALRTGNLLLLKGGKEAYESNSCLVGMIRELLQQHGLASRWVNLLGTSRQELTELLQQHAYLDLCIPRGSSALIDFVRQNSLVPVIETGAGVVHLYCDESADLGMATGLIYNSKMRRLSVCNALDCLLLHENLLPHLPYLVRGLAEDGVRLHCDARSLKALQSEYPGELLLPVASYGREFLSAQMCIKVLSGLSEAVEHIAQFGSRHTEVIVTEDEGNAALFCREVDAASVFVNMASGFSDGGEFGLGAEVGISTQKLHARGPMGLEALTCAKWLGRGQGQVR